MTGRRLSPYEREFLWALDEIGDDDVAALVNAALHALPAGLSKDLERFREALWKLLNRGFVVVARESLEYEAFHAAFAWDDSWGGWNWVGADKPIVSITSSGESAVVE